MVVGIIAGLQGITDEELNELALAVAAELSRRQAENLAAPEPSRLRRKARRRRLLGRPSTGACGTTRANVATFAMCDG